MSADERYLGLGWTIGLGLSVPAIAAVAWLGLKIASAGNLIAAFFGGGIALMSPVFGALIGIRVGFLVVGILEVAHSFTDNASNARPMATEKIERYHVEFEDGQKTSFNTAGDPAATAARLWPDRKLRSIKLLGRA